ncbi:MAG: single-stranded-DNA-specific exonuclease RecJ, partial [Thermoflexia bacterium]
ARSIPEFHIAEALNRCDDLLLQHGGHALAAGFTLRTEFLDALRERLLEEAARRLAGLELVPALRVDAEVPLKAMTVSLWEAIQQLQPFGEGNPEPLFLTRNVWVRRAVPVGAENAHLKLTLSDGWAVWDGIAFGRGEWAGQMPERVDIVYHLRRDEWNGAVRAQLHVQDWREAKKQ